MQNNCSQNDENCCFKMNTAKANLNFLFCESQLEWGFLSLVFDFKQQGQTD